MENASDDRIWADSVQFQCFAAGIFLCLILRGRAPQVGLWMRSLLLAGSGLCWLIACGGPDSAYAIADDTSARWTILSRVFLISAGSILMLLAFLGLSWRLLPRWAVYLGRISFGLYVFHGVARDLSFYIFPKNRRLPRLHVHSEILHRIGIDCGDGSHFLSVYRVTIPEAEETPHHHRKSTSVGTSGRNWGCY